MNEKLSTFVMGLDWTSWCIGFQLHKGTRIGTVLEINFLPITVYVRLKKVNKCNN